MKSYLLQSLLLWLVVPLALTAQTPERSPADSTDYDEWEDPWEDTWNLDSLDPNDYDISADLVDHYSHGWFPTPGPGGSLMFSFPIFWSYSFDRASGLRSSALVPTVEPFSYRDPYRCSILESLFGTCREREILKRNSDDPIDEDPPERSFTEYAVRLEYHLPIPAMLRLEGNLRLVDAMLYTEDTTRSFLTLAGGEQQFREIGGLLYQRTMIGGSAGLQIPIYGAFVGSEALTGGSYYYLYGGISGMYAVWNKATQFFQIADAKEHLRYDNGMDTATVIRDVSPPGFTRFRTAVEAALGWQVNFEVVSFGFEAFTSIPSTSLLTDATWKDYHAGFRIGLGYHWQPDGSD